MTKIQKYEHSKQQAFNTAIFLARSIVKNGHRKPINGGQIEMAESILKHLAIMQETPEYAKKP